jgi:NtrC-family two-component system response regulator AlgB
MRSFQSAFRQPRYLYRNAIYASLNAPEVVMAEIQAALPLRTVTPLNILVVDDEVNIQVTLGACLELDGHHVVARGNGREALAETGRQVFDLIFLDVRLGTENGLDYIQPLLAFNPWAKIVVITAYASIETAVEAMRRGATDYLPKPFSPAQVELVTANVAERRRLELNVEALQAVLGDDPEVGFPTANAEMLRTLELARQVAASAAPVLIIGEPGTGKGRLARAIHAWSPRERGTYAVASCQTSSPEALEEELFGLASDAGGDAPPEKLGRVDFCNGGTLILDEIGSTPLSVQPKIERLLIDRQYERRDDFSVRDIDVRLLATSSINLEEAVTRRRFRQELLLALDVVRVEIPPLRRRPEDIRLLAERYLAYYARQNNRKVTRFTSDAMNALLQHTWPGNQRELRNLVERAVILCPAERIELKHFPPNFLNSPGNYQPGDLVPLDTIEDIHIRGVLAATGTVKSAASVLGVNYSTLWRRLRKGPGEPETADPPAGVPEAGT